MSAHDVAVTMTLNMVVRGATADEAERLGRQLAERVAAFFECTTPDAQGIDNFDGAEKITEFSLNDADEAIDVDEAEDIGE